MKNVTIKKTLHQRRMYRVILSAALLLALKVEKALAQDGGKAGLEEATNMISGYFDPSVNH